jgi:hypothetical protein
MTIRYVTLCAAAVVAAMVMQGTSAKALTMAECSAKYKEAKANNTLNGMKWNDFRKAQCGAEASAAPGATPASNAASAPPAAPKSAAAPISVGNAVFPSTVDAKFSGQKAHLARLHTCSEQWQANKANKANGTMKWSQYYSECNKRLRGGT